MVISTNPNIFFHTIPIFQTIMIKALDQEHHRRNSVCLKHGYFTLNMLIILFVFNIFLFIWRFNFDLRINIRAARFYNTEEEFEKLHFRLKLYRCPYCGQIGFLILHGSLYGYSEDSNTQKIKRGHRIFCSNRKRRKGCGGSFSILKAEFIKNFMVSGLTVWKFLSGIKEDTSLIEAFRRSGSGLGEASAYRLLRKFKHNQARLRTFMTRVKGPPILKHCKDAVIQTIAHLKSLFPQSPCPVSEFQYCFQASFF